MKKKLLFKKIVALICCVTMCLATFAPVVANAAEPLAGSPTATMFIPEGAEIRDEMLAPLIESRACNSYAYTYDSTTRTIKFSAKDNESLLGKTIVFYAIASVEPTVTSELPPVCTAKVELVGGTWWKISIVFGDLVGFNAELTYTPGVEKVNVNFPKDPSGYTIYVGNQKVSGTTSCDKGSLTFEVEPDQGMEIAEVKVDRQLVTGTNGFYTIDAAEGTSVEITVRAKTYTVTGPDKSDDYDYEIDSDYAPNAVPYNGNFKFQITPKNGYTTVDSVTYTYVDAQGKEQTTTLTRGANNTYTIRAIQSDITAITVVVGGKSTYHINYPDGDEFTISGVKAGTSAPATVGHGDSFSFVVTPETGYTIRSVTANNRTVAAVNGVYTVSNVTVETTIAVNTAVKKWTVKVLDNTDGQATLTCQDGDTVNHNADYSFAVIPGDGFAAPTVKVEGGTLIPNGTNNYIVSRVQSDITITIAAPAAKQYNVTYPYDDNYTVEGEAKATHNQKHTFTVTPATGYEITRVAATVNGATTTLTGTKSEDGDGFTYETPAVTTDVTIAVTVQLKKFTVTVDNKAGDKVITNVRTTPNKEYGSSVDFSVTAATGYGAPTVTADPAEALHPLGNGQYSVNVTGPVTITIDAGAPKGYAVIYNAGEGYSFDASNPRSVTYGTDLTFTVNANPGYDIVGVTVSVANSPVNAQKNDDGSYTVANVTGAVSVSASASLVGYKVTVDNKDTNAASTSAVDGETVKLGDTYKFTVSAKPGYTAPSVTVNGKSITASEGNQYSVVVDADVVEKKGLTIVITAGNPITYTVTVASGDGFSGAGTSGIGHGNSFAGEITVDAQYSNSAIEITANNVRVDATSERQDNGSVVYTYEIKNIMADQTVRVSGLKKNTYTVELVPGKGYTLEKIGDLTVEAGGSVKFVLVTADGFNSDNAKVMAGNIEIEKNDADYYTIDDVNANIVVTVTGVTENAYKVACTVTPSGDNATVTAINGTSLTGIPFGGSCRIQVTTKPGYRVAQVTLGGSPLNLIAGSYYEISDIRADKEIVVETVANVLTVTYQSNEEAHPISDVKTFTYDKLIDAVAFNATGCTLHELVKEAWHINGGEEIATPGNLQALIVNSDNAVTLTAKYKTNYDAAVRALVTLGKTDVMMEKQANGTYKFSFGTKVQKLVSEDPCLAAIADELQLVSFGSILGRGTNADLSLGNVKSAVENLSVTGTYKLYLADKVQQVVVYLHNGDDLNLGAMVAANLFEYIDGQYLLLDVASTSVNPNVAAIGFMVIQVGDSKVVLVSGAARPVNDVPALETEV